MDYKAIEAALDECMVTFMDRDPHRDIDRVCYEVCENHAKDLLRIVHAIVWLDANGGMLMRSNDHWCVGVAGRCEMFNGQSPLDAIEAAMADTDQQTKGPTDEAREAAD